MPSFTDMLAQRQAAAQRVAACTKHLDRDELIFLLACHIPIDALEGAVLSIYRDANPRGVLAARAPQKGRR